MIIKSGGLVPRSKTEIKRCPEPQCEMLLTRPIGASSICAKGHQVPPSPRLIGDGEGCELIVPLDGMSQRRPITITVCPGQFETMGGRIIQALANAAANSEKKGPC